MNQVVFEAHSGLLNGLPHIKDVMPIGSEDAALLVEIREVLHKHGALRRFGLQLLHKHYDLHNDEVLQEVTDEESRISTVKPITKEQFRSKMKDAEVTYTTVFFPDGADASPHGVVTLGCIASCLSHNFGKVHRVV